MDGTYYDASLQYLTDPSTVAGASYFAGNEAGAIDAANAIEVALADDSGDGFSDPYASALLYCVFRTIVTADSA